MHSLDWGNHMKSQCLGTSQILESAVFLQMQNISPIDHNIVEVPWYIGVTSAHSTHVLWAQVQIPPYMSIRDEFSSFVARGAEVSCPNIASFSIACTKIKWLLLEYYLI